MGCSFGRAVAGDMALMAVMGIGLSLDKSFATVGVRVDLVGRVEELIVGINQVFVVLEEYLAELAPCIAFAFRFMGQRIILSGIKLVVKHLDLKLEDLLAEMLNGIVFVFVVGHLCLE